jgi:hypothetical protein
MAGGRSFADPLSSSVQFTAYDLKLGLGDLLVQRLPYIALPQVLHELTHQWCFNSVVGRTVTYLLFRAQREAALGDPKRRVWRDAHRAEMIQHILLPLAEGMALFAEHDLYPGSVESTSRPLLACAPIVAFRLSDPQGPQAMFDNLSKKLLAARMRPTHIDRKASLLFEPLSSHASPYGIGYLTTKALRVQGARRDQRLLDPDLFLQVIHGYFYEDWGLVAELLADDFAHEVDATEHLLSYVGNRLNRFAQSIDSRAIDTFIDRCLNRSEQRQLFECKINDLDASFWVDQFETSTINDGQSKFKALIQEALDLSVIRDERLGTLASTQWFVNATATLITLGGADVAARRLPYHIMLMMDDTVPSAILPYSGTLPAGWEGTLRVVAALIVEQASLIVLMFDGENLVGNVGFDALRKRLPDHHGQLDLIANPMLDPRERSKVGSLLREVIQECVGDISVRRRHEIDNEIDSLYLSAFEFMHGHHGAAASIIATLPRRRLLDLLNDDLGVAESAALASLLAASPIAHSHSPTEPAKLSEHITLVNRQLAPLFGFPPIAVSQANDLIYSAV